jgi:hypothetical protein
VLLTPVVPRVDFDRCRCRWGGLPSSAVRNAADCSRRRSRRTRRPAGRRCARCARAALFGLLRSWSAERYFIEAAASRFTAREAGLSERSRCPARHGCSAFGATGSRVFASVSVTSHEAPAPDHEREPRSRPLLRRRERSPAPCSRSRSQPGWTKARALVRGPARTVDARTGKLAPLLLRLVARVIGCRGDAAIMRRGSDASTTRGHTIRRCRRARPLGAATPGDTAPGRTGSGPCRHRRNASPLEVVMELAVGSFVGPNLAVLGRIRPIPERYWPRPFGPICRYFHA